MDDKNMLDSVYDRSSEKYEKGVSLWSILLGCAALVVFILALTFAVFMHTSKANTDFDVEKAAEHLDSPPCEPISLDSYTFDIAEDIYSRAAIMINHTTGHVVCTKNTNAELFPASLTKMMTVIVALEKIGDPNKTITVGGQSFARLAEENASVAGIKPGDNMTLLDLCYATILPSGADAAVTLAEYCYGSEESFVAQMNLRAVELGMNDTHFCNVTGLHDDNHYSTAFDMGIMLNHALSNEYFHKVITTQSYTIPTTGLTVYSTVFEKANAMTKNKFKKAELLGGKSGYTPEAGLCLATVTKLGDNEFLTITLCADGTLYTPQYAMIDSMLLVNTYAY